MAQFSIDPPATSDEVRHAASLVLKAKEARGFTTDTQVAEDMGLRPEEISRLIHGVTRKWGHSRLSRIAEWLGVSVDKLLNRPEGTTKPGPTTRKSMPRAEVVRLADQIADTKISFLRMAEHLVRDIVDNKVDEPTILRLIDAVEKLAEVHAGRLARLYGPHLSEGEEFAAAGRQTPEWAQLKREGKIEETRSKVTSKKP
ncbi:MAG TPA: helix-turn-helix domain-containing protein [bacterium]|jgi:transcriptional regulator with XRE-family HTH domain